MLDIDKRIELQMPVLILGPLGYEPNTLTTAQIRRMLEMRLSANFDQDTSFDHISIITIYNKTRRGVHKFSKC